MHQVKLNTTKDSMLNCDLHTEFCINVLYCLYDKVRVEFDLSNFSTPADLSETLGNNLLQISNPR